MVGWALDIYLARLGISPAETFVDDLVVGIVAASLAYTWVTLLAAKHLRQQTNQRVRQDTVLEERNRMACEFHDTVAQTLVGVVLQLGACQSLLDDRPDAKKHVVQAAGLVREGVREAREAVWNVWPEALRGSDLPAAMAQLAKRVKDGTSLRVEFSFEGRIRELPGSVEKDFLRIAQEALTNVVKHAQATKVTAVLTLREDDMELTVEDNGVGFESDCEYLGRTFGLTSMHEWASALGGICRIHGQHGQGTTVRVAVPIGPAIQ